MQMKRCTKHVIKRACNEWNFQMRKLNIKVQFELDETYETHKMKTFRTVEKRSAAIDKHNYISY